MLLRYNGELYERVDSEDLNDLSCLNENVDSDRLYENSDSHLSYKAEDNELYENVDSGELYEYVDAGISKEDFEEGMRDLQKLVENSIQKTYFGLAEDYLKDMSIAGYSSDHLYKEALKDLQQYILAFQKFARTVKRLPNFEHLR